MRTEQPLPSLTAGTPLESRWVAAAICLALAAMTFAVFGRTAGFDFVNYDDDLFYTNPRVVGGVTWKAIAWEFTHPDAMLYHPLTMISFMVDRTLYGTRPGGYHLTNVFLHTGSVLLLFLVLRSMTGAIWRSAFVAAVFAIHPMRVESVAWVAERKDVLGGFFFMLTLAAYVRYARQPRSALRYAGVMASFALALLSKPSVVMVPVLLWLLDYWPLRRKEQLSRLLLEKILLLMLAGAAALATLSATNGLIRPGVVLSGLARTVDALVYYTTYLRQIIWPGALAAMYPNPPNGFSGWEGIVAGIILALLSAMAWKERRTKPWLLVGWLWYVAMLLPMSGLQPAGFFAQADRYTYLPHIGVYLAIAWLVAEASWNPAILGSLMAVVVIALMAVAMVQTGYWRDNETLWRHTIECTTNNYTAYDHLALTLLNKGQLDEAIETYQQSLRIHSDNPKSQSNLALALLQKGRVDEAVEHYRQSLQLDPADAKAHFTLGNALRRQRQDAAAIAEYETALRLDPNDAFTHYNLGLTLAQHNRLKEALPQLQAAIRLKPDFVQAENEMGKSLHKTGRLEDATVHFQKALALAPADESLHFNLAGILAERGRTPEAISQYENALRLVPNDAEALNNLAWLRATCPQAELRNGPEAVQLAQRANVLTGGKNAIILGTLAASLAETSRFDDATRAAQRAESLAQAEGAAALSRRLTAELQLYQARRPFHQP